MFSETRRAVTMTSSTPALFCAHAGDIIVAASNAGTTIRMANFFIVLPIFPQPIRAQSNGRACPVAYLLGFGEGRAQYSAFVSIARCKSATVSGDYPWLQPHFTMDPLQLDAHAVKSRRHPNRQFADQSVVIEGVRH